MSEHFRWQLTAAGRAMFGDRPIDPAAWDTSIVKANARRTIARAQLPGGAVYVKTCRPATPRALAREILRGPKAKLEFDNLCRLAALKVGALEPLAWGHQSAWPGASVLLTREADGARTLAEVLDTPTPSVWQRLARDFGAFVAGLHAVGIAHPDPHPGNILVDARGRFLLADVHDLPHAQGPLSWPRRWDDLVAWNRFFQLRASRVDRRRFWRAYTAGYPLPDSAAGGIEAATRTSNLRFWTRRLKRPLLDNRETRRIPGGYAARDLTLAELARWAKPDAVLANRQGECWKDSASATVAPVVVQLVGGDMPGVIKRFHLKSWSRVVKNALRRSPALRVWVLGHNLRDRGLPTPRPLLYLARKRFGLLIVEYVLFERVPDCLELPAAVTLATGQPDGTRWLKPWSERVGKLIAAMHEKQVSHRDLKAANVLLTGISKPETATPVLIDLVGVVAGRPVPVPIRQRDLARLAASFARDGRITNSIRLVALRAYLGPRHEWKAMWRELATRVEAKTRQNARRGRVLA